MDTVLDYSKTLFLPKTKFPPGYSAAIECYLRQHWETIDLYGMLRDSSSGRPSFVLHDGPPYANGPIHMGHALNKILKDIVVKSKQMSGYDANYVPGWDCHGLPIEWKVEEEFYRTNGQVKPDLSDISSILAFRDQCRRFAERWVRLQSEDFQKLGIIGDFHKPYKTMDFSFEAGITEELHKFAMSGLLYRGCKPVMWSVVERTALAEAEVEYLDYKSDSIYVKFPLDTDIDLLSGANILIWTTTPWTLPGNRAISYSEKLSYGIYSVTKCPDICLASIGDMFLLADTLSEEVFAALGAEEYLRVDGISHDLLGSLICNHPLSGIGYTFKVPLLSGDHVTDETGTGFVHTAPGHGQEDFDVWMRHSSEIEKKGISLEIPFTVDDDGRFTHEVPGFSGESIIDAYGNTGTANTSVIGELTKAKSLVARNRVLHKYPHSWRSKKPIIYRNTFQWFIAMDSVCPDLGDILGNENREVKASKLCDDGKVNEKDLTHRDNEKSEEKGFTLRDLALMAIEDQITFHPSSSKNRLLSMVMSKPDWVLSRQRVWGVPIAIFRNIETGTIAPGPGFLGSEELANRICSAIRSRGADVWFDPGAKKEFLDGLVDDPDKWEKVTDILDVWFDSGSSYIVCMNRNDLEWPADMYLEGSDQHRGWFQSSLLESCGVNGRSPYRNVLTHGFVLDEKGRKMSKALGNVVTPQEVIDRFGVDVLRLWVITSDFSEDLRISYKIMETIRLVYRKLRTTLKWMLGSLTHFKPEMRVDCTELPELEKFILHSLNKVSRVVHTSYDEYNFKDGFSAIMRFITADLSAFYFDVRKDVLYCDPVSSLRRASALTTIELLFQSIVKLLSPMLPFVTEEAWGYYQDGSVHLEVFPEVPENWDDPELEEKWNGIRKVRKVINGALELERASKRIGSSLEAGVTVYVTDQDLIGCLEGADLEEIAIVSSAEVLHCDGPTEAFRLDEVPGVSVVPSRAKGRKCARSWKISEQIGSDPDYPDVTPRDADALREWMDVK